MRRKAAADRAEKVSNQRPSSTRAAGAGGSSSTMLSKFSSKRSMAQEEKEEDGVRSMSRNSMGGARELIERSKSFHITQLQFGQVLTTTFRAVH